jgi:Uncharacterized protein conserved in bacteria
MKIEVLLENVTKLISPIVEGLNYELYHVEYVEEEEEYFLRIYIDKPEGITLEDCEKVSRPISDILDQNDPIEDSYYLEVSSPGINRELHNDRHLEKYTGSNVSLKLSKAVEGQKNLEGILSKFSSDEIVIVLEQKEIKIPRNLVESINLEGEL